MPADPIEMPADTVAIIGAGPGGLVAARWLKAHGLEPVLFEAAARPGGQWNPAAPGSATWSGMRTNTSRVVTAFSDLDHAEGTPVYPCQDQVLAYLDRYAERFGLQGSIRCATRVERLEKAPGGGWLVGSSHGGQARVERFARVVVASGRHREARLPSVPGLEGFSGALGVAHAGSYGGASTYRGRDVLVAGCSISALEIASDLALAGARRVTACYRRQRYVLPKLIAGVPTDHRMFTRAAALAGEALPADAVAAGLKATVEQAAGRPEQFGAMATDPDIFRAGISQAQHFLPLVAEGRIAVRPWLEAVEGQSVRFADGSRDRFDAILLGTGYRLSLPFLSPELQAALGLDGLHLDLCHHSFHPEMEGLAFLGLFDLIGPYFPVLELQARFIAHAWSGAVAPLSRDVLQAGLARSRAARSGPPAVPMHAMALQFARLAGVEPDPERWPDLKRALLFGPLSPASFRLEGPDADPDAPAHSAAAAAAFGAIRSGELTGEESGLLELVRAATTAQAA
jgi:dimethylaniline monooxygenase (N-oxide forming)